MTHPTFGYVLQYSPWFSFSDKRDSPFSLAKFLPDLDALANMTICPSLSAFKFSADPSLLDMSLFNRTHLEASTSSSATSSLHQPVNLLDDLTVYENAGHGAGTQDFFDDVGNNFDNDCMGGGDGGDDYDMGLGSGGGGHEGYGDGGDDDLSDNGIESSMQGSGGQHLGAVQRFAHRLTEDQREVVIGMGGEDGDRKVFSYFDSALSKNWAGPEHWKMRRTARKVMQENDQESPAADDGTNKSSKSKRTPKEPFHINFSVDVEAPSSKTIFATSNASITMPVSKRKAGRLQEKKEDFLLPDDMHFSSQQLLRLFLKPKAAVSDFRRKSDKDIFLIFLSLSRSTCGKGCTGRHQDLKARSTNIIGLLQRRLKRSVLMVVRVRFSPGSSSPTMDYNPNFIL